MKAQNTIKIAIISGLILCSSTICGANNALAKGIRKKNPAAPAAVPIDTPELQQASERVQECKERLSTARKQLNAAKALLNAADADLKAAVAEHKALALKTTAQGMADQSGLKTAIGQSSKSDPVASALDNAGGGAASDSMPLRQ